MLGAFDPDSFVPWIGRYASKLGLAPEIVGARQGRVEVEVVGEAELIDMLAIGCSLGPVGVRVDSIDHHAVAARGARVLDVPVFALKGP